MAIYDKLEHELKLSDLVNGESLSNLIDQFSKYHRAGFTVTNSDGALLRPAIDRFRFCDAPPADPAAPPSDGVCALCSYDVPRFADRDEKFIEVGCGDRVHYLRVRIDNQFEPIGFLILGPFVKQSQEASRHGRHAVTRQPLLSGGEVELPMFGGDEVREVAQLLCTVVEEVVFANYQSYLFEKMHLQLSTEQLGDLTKKDGELQDYEETLLESGELRSLF